MACYASAVLEAYFHWIIGLQVFGRIHKIVVLRSVPLMR